MLLCIAVKEEGGEVITIKVQTLTRNRSVCSETLCACLCAFVIVVYVILSLFVAIVFHDLAWSLLHRRVGCAITRIETV